MKIPFYFLLFFFISLYTANISAQIDVKLSPINLIFNSPNVSAEYIVNEHIGIELLVGVDYGTVVGSDNISEMNRLTKSGYRFRMLGKYYFREIKGGDGWYTGLYTGVRSRTDRPSQIVTTAVGRSESLFETGIHGGYKFVLNTNIVFDLGAGFGRSFAQKLSITRFTSVNNFSSRFALNSFLKLEMGYRF